MTVVFLARAGAATDHIAAALSSTQNIYILLERGGPARIRKLKRYFQFSKFWQWPSRALDVGAIALYNWRQSRSLEAALPAALPRSALEIRSCDDANDEQAVAALTEWKPNLVLIYGTSILSRKTLSLCPVFLNIHTGLVPRYRQVHSEFWALAEGDTEGLGTSILYVTEGIDDGDVALQERLPAQPTVSAALVANTRLAARLAQEAVAQFRQGSLPRIPQETSSQRNFKTPTALALLRAWLWHRPKL